MPDPIRSINATDAPGVASAGSVGPGQSGNSATQPPTNAPVDSADVATVEALLATITKAANAVPPVDQTRVAQLQQAINSGTYQANPERIAKMIMEIEELLAPHGKIE